MYAEVKQTKDGALGHSDPAVQQKAEEGQLHQLQCAGEQQHGAGAFQPHQRRDAVQQAETHAPAGSAKFIVQVPEHADALIDTRLVRTAIYNLLTNALRVTPEDGEITVSLTDTRDFVTIAVADTGPGLDPAKFDDLLSGWRRTTSMDDYRALVRGGTPLGLGLPLVNQIAQAHGGRLLLTQREGGGSVLHLCLAHLPHTLEDDLFRAPTIIEDGYTAEEIEFSILE